MKNANRQIWVGENEKCPKPILKKEGGGVKGGAEYVALKTIRRTKTGKK